MQNKLQVEGGFTCLVCRVWVITDPEAGIGLVAGVVIAVAVVATIPNILDQRRASFLGCKS